MPYVVVLMLALAILGGCAGDPAEDHGAGGQIVAAMALSGAAAPGAVAAGVQMTLNLPPNVEPLLNNDGSVASGVVSVVGPADQAAVQLLADYVPGSGGGGGALSFIAVYPAGFVAGDFLRVRLELKSGFNAGTAVFPVSNFVVSDPDGNVVTGLLPTVTARYY